MHLESSAIVDRINEGRYLITPYEVIEFGQKWFRQWPVARRHKVIA